MREREASPPIAHRRREDDATHDLSEHLYATAQLAKGFAETWGGGEAARLMGLWHDLGKYSAEFQDMIRGADAEAHLEGVPMGRRRRVDHSTSGAQWAVKRFGLFGRLLAYGIAGHHAGLPDWVGEGASRGMKDRLDDARHLDRALAGGPPSDLLNQPEPKVPLPVGADPGLWTRMVASALFDADFLDAEAFFDRGRAAARAIWPTLAVLERRLDKHIDENFARVAKTPVNALRAEVLSACRAAAGKSPGLFSLSVPTGGGKTLSSLAFALAHARHHGLRRVVYAIPFTSIIEQMADVFRNALGRDAVLEHHSALGPRPEEETARSRLAAENWDAPVIATTTVQLFESLFASRTSRVRKLHNLARSVIVLDEAQALPAAVLRPVTAVIDQLVRHYGVSIVLCTATQPALGSVFRELSRQYEIAPNPERLFAELDRVTVVLPERDSKLSWESIATEVARERQALAVVNTRRDCRTLHALLPKDTCPPSAIVRQVGLVCEWRVSGSS
jgi:CRISPR-associated endonuclease/helicase Cas3